MNGWSVVIFGILKPLTISVDVLANHTRLKASFVLNEFIELCFVMWVAQFLF